MSNPQVTIFHNSRCSKSRQTLQILEDKGIKPVIIKYLDTPPSVETLKQILSLLNLAPRELMRTKESLYQDNNLNNPELSNDELIAAMHQYPKLIERPIVIANNQARIGRPPESILEIL